MRKFTRVLSLVLTLAIMLCALTSLSACNDDNESTGDNNAPSGDNANPGGTPDGGNTNPGGDNTAPGGENEAPDTGNTTPGGDNNPTSPDDTTPAPIQNTLHLNGNGATGGNMTDVKMNSGANASLPKNTYVKDGYTFSGWSTTANGDVEYSDEASYTMGDVSEYTLYAVWTPVAPAYIRVDKNGDESTNGGYIKFGSYPQSEVTDDELKNTLSAMAGTPSNGKWTAYDYYVSGTVTGFMLYQDISYNEEMYRGVFFTSYRTFSPFDESSADMSAQDDNGYVINSLYWFKYEPIAWRILQEQNGKAFLLCEMAIDAQSYYFDANNNANSSAYPNNYEYSTIRKWLNDNFYNTAFTALEKQLIELTEVDNTLASTGDTENSYVCANTNDYVFLLSVKETLMADYGFADDNEASSTREKKSTDYAKCQGIYTHTEDSYNGNCHWWLRTPMDFSECDAHAVTYNGDVKPYSFYVDITQYGVVPALWINL